MSHTRTGPGRPPGCLPAHFLHLFSHTSGDTAMVLRCPLMTKPSHFALVDCTLVPWYPKTQMCIRNESKTLLGFVKKKVEWCAEVARKAPAWDHFSRCYAISALCNLID